MKKIIAVMLILALMLLCACSPREEISRELIDYDFTPAHNETVTTYTTVPCGSSFVTLPVTNTYHYDDKYELLYRVSYDDGSDAKIWEEVTEREYDNAVKELEKNDDRP